MDKTEAIKLSDALRQAKRRGWPPTPIREAVVAGDIPSFRSSGKFKARYFVWWRDIERHFKAL